MNKLNMNVDITLTKKSFVKLRQPSNKGKRTGDWGPFHLAQI